MEGTGPLISTRVARSGRWVRAGMRTLRGYLPHSLGRRLYLPRTGGSCVGGGMMLNLTVPSPLRRHGPACRTARPWTTPPDGARSRRQRPFMGSDCASPQPCPRAGDHRFARAWPFTSAFRPADHFSRRRRDFRIHRRQWPARRRSGGQFGRRAIGAGVVEAGRRRRLRRPRSGRVLARLGNHILSDHDHGVHLAGSSASAHHAVPGAARRDKNPAAGAALGEAVDATPRSGPHGNAVLRGDGRVRRDGARARHRPTAGRHIFRAWAHHHRMGPQRSSSPAAPSREGPSRLPPGAFALVQRLRSLSSVGPAGRDSPSDTGGDGIGGGPLRTDACRNARQSFAFS